MAARVLLGKHRLALMSKQLRRPPGLRRAGHLPLGLHHEHPQPLRTRGKFGCKGFKATGDAPAALEREPSLQVMYP